MSGLMSDADYYAAVRRLGLSPTAIPTVYAASDGLTYNVPEPANLPDEVKRGTLKRLAENLGR